MGKYVEVIEAKRMICEIGKRMYLREFVAANDGNISIRIGENQVACTPTGVSKGYMTPEMICVVDMEGNHMEGELKPSSEMKMHLRVFKENSELTAVVHAHPQVATSFSIVGVDMIKPIMSEAVLLLGPIHIAPYAKPGTEEVPDSIAPYCNGYNGVLLANHGALTWGRNPLEAYYRMEAMEHYAKVLMNTTQIFKSNNELTEKHVEGLMEIRKRMEF